MTQLQVAVCGAGVATAEDEALAEEVGRLLAEAGATVVCGGMAGVMDAAARGARAAGGTVLGILPGVDRSGASEHLSVAVPTGMGEARNALVAGAADVVIAIRGEWGTLSEIAHALKMGKPVVGIDTWGISKNGEPVDAIHDAETPEAAVEAALRLGRS